jgi:hypothetical protein
MDMTGFRMIPAGIGIMGRLGGRRTIPARRPYIPANLISTACLATADEVIE